METKLISEVRSVRSGDRFTHRVERLSRRKIGATSMLRNVFVSAVLCASAIAEERVPLAEFVRDAVASSDVVLAAEAAFRAEKERRIAAQRSYHNPELSIDMEKLDSVDGVEGRRAVIGMSQRVDLHGKRRARMTIAEANELVARAELDGVRTDVTVQLLTALAEWRSASRRVRLLTAHEQTMESFVALTERQRAAGDISKMEVDLAKLARAQTSMHLATAKAARSTAEERVRYLSSIGDDQRWPELNFQLPVLHDEIEGSVSTLPVVRAAVLLAQVASAEADAEGLNRRPDPTISFGIGREAGERLAEIGVSLPLNVFDRGTSAVSAAKEDAREALRISKDIVRRARVRLEASAERYRIARGTWTEWLREGAESLGGREELAKKSWEAGELEPVDYLTHLDAALELRMQALNLRQAVWLAWFEWLKASEGLADWLGLDTGARGL